MSRIGNITEVNITSTQAKTGAFSAQCPYDAGTSDRRTWFQHLVQELARSVGAGKTFKLVCSDGNYYLDRTLVSSATITYSS